MVSPNMTQTNFFLQKELHAKLKEISKNTHIGMSELLRMGVNMVIERMENKTV